MLDTTNAKKTVWVVSDGIPGHFNQSKGVLFALERLYTLDVHWLELKLIKRWLRRPLGWILNHGLLPLGVMSFFYDNFTLPQVKPDIVIGAGGNSSFAVTWIARSYQAKSIFCGSLRKLNPELFDAVLVLEPDLPPPFISLTISPMALDQQKLEDLASEWRGTRTVPLYTMLVGGDGAGVQYEAEDWYVLANAMNQIAKQQNIRWLISTSRRTGAQAEKFLKDNLLADVIEDAVWWSEKPRSILHTYLAVSEGIFCGIDSMSMIMESLASRRKLIVYKPKQTQPDERFSNILNRLEENNLLRCMVLEELQGTDGFEQMKTLEYDAIEKLAQLLKERL
ncbi:ELM1/GtrOC1 family putative glycosyltransferase [Acinetobacter thermotolerans]|uniref:ELM1/GtrOC1 family putative glycosyltransferase n=1 Tax=Acinetobacter thermotolerans TaxID=3151487 RepID=UPI00325C1189